MGLDCNGTKFLLYAKSQNVDFSRTAMIGRQLLYVKPPDLRKNLSHFGFAVTEEMLQTMLRKHDGYAEEFLRYLGAVDVHSFDFSRYEGATHIHDMNYPIPADLKGKYSVVLDGGSLEHVFNFPVAVKNCMEMVRVGGHYLGITPANNFMGHGFYQFSPELYFSLFSDENGYEVSVIACEDDYDARWFAVRKPKEISARVTLVNSVPAYLLVLARRTRDCAILERMPQQSDYVVTWDGSGRGAPGPRRVLTWKAVHGFLRRHLPTPLKKHGRRVIYHLSRSFSPRFFSRLKS